MSRRDIADYLGLTFETVPRTLSTLRDRDLLRFEGTTQKRIELLRRKELAELGPPHLPNSTHIALCLRRKTATSSRSNAIAASWCGTNSPASQ